VEQVLTVNVESLHLKLGECQIDKPVHFSIPLSIMGIDINEILLQKKMTCENTSGWL
jgi:hypothetical protein